MRGVPCNTGSCIIPPLHPVAMPSSINVLCPMCSFEKLSWHQLRQIEFVEPFKGQTVLGVHQVQPCHSLRYSINTLQSACLIKAQSFVGLQRGPCGCNVKGSRFLLHRINHAAVWPFCVMSVCHRRVTVK